MYKAWYRKWRPTNFDEVCGQDQVTDILKYQVANGKTSHAYLFCGSRGTGKTSCAKILARAVNCEHPMNGNPCNECYACRSILSGTATDVIEIDAASNNGVDNVRDIREEVNFTPAELSFRVYIIDEVHMMSPSAFNALLKTLEEPPAHVIFILATTELQKLPSTIISRCQRYDFRRLPSLVLIDRMKKIAAEEGVELTEDGARVIARMAQGGMRDTVSLLELCAGSRRKIDEALAESILGAGNRDDVIRLVRAVAGKDYETIYSIVSDVVMSSRDLAVFWQELIGVYRDLAVMKTAKDAKEYLDLTDMEFSALSDTAQLFTVSTLLYHAKVAEEAYGVMQRSAALKRTTAEMALLRMCEPRFSASPEAMQTRITALEEQVNLLKLGIVPSKEIPIIDEKSKAETEPIVKETPAPIKEEPARAAAEPAYHALGYWAELVEQLSQQYGGIAGFLRHSAAYFAEEKGYLIRAASSLSAKMLSRPETMTVIKNFISTYEEKNISVLPFAIVAEGETKGMNLMDEVMQALEEETE